jgi:hypothetical protein
MNMVEMDNFVGVSLDSVHCWTVGFFCIFESSSVGHLTDKLIMNTKDAEYKADLPPWSLRSSDNSSL